MKTPLRIDVVLLGISVLATMASFSCAGASAGTRPGDMSAAAHDRAAVAATQWRSSTSPTPQDREEQERASALAAKHRSAAKTLRDAEALSCDGIAEADRDLSPFAHRSEIEGVRQLHGSAPSQNGSHVLADIGATIHFRPVSGLTKEKLQKIIDCHLARNAALGNDTHADPYCPLVPKAVRATVRSEGEGFDVDVSSEDPISAAEVWARAQHLRG